MTKARILAQVVSAGRALADGQVSGAYIVGLDISASETLTKLKTVDGIGSGLDSDLLDGQNGIYYLDWTNTTNKPDPVITITGDISGTTTLTDLASGTITSTLASVGTSGTYTKVTTDSKGRITSGTTLIATDIPSLDASKITSGVLDAARLPSYVDDILEYTNLAGFPVTGEQGKIYVALDTNKTYRWSGSTYIYITSGAVDSVAGKTGVITLVKGDVGLGNVDNTSDAAKSVNYAATAGGVLWSGITSKPTTLSGYGITDAQPSSTAITTSNIGSQSVNYATTAGSATDSTKLPLAGGILTGGLREAKVTMAANDINLNLGNYFTKTISGATTLTVSNIPATGTVASFILDLTNGGSATITWWTGMDWASGTAPTLTTSGRDVLGFFTHDGGTTWNGVLIAKDIR